MKPIVVRDMTKLFTKEILLYALFDVRFRNPVRITYIMYFMLTGLIWSAPILYFFFPPNVYVAMIAGIPPFIVANLLSQPIWNGKSFLSWLSCLLKFSFSKKHYYDGKGIKKLNKYKVDSVYIVSRRADYERLFREIQEERERKYGRKK